MTRHYYVGSSANSSAAVAPMLGRSLRAQFDVQIQLPMSVLLLLILLSKYYAVSVSPRLIGGETK